MASLRDYFSVADAFFYFEIILIPISINYLYPTPNM